MTGHADPMVGLNVSLGVLGVSLAWWEQRETARDKVAARKAGFTAVDAIDSMLRQLYMARGRLTRELRQANDALIDGAR